MTFTQTVHGDIVNRSYIGGAPAATAAELTGQSTDWINAVTVYGADPAGAADSTAAIQAALWAATAGQVVYLPTGTYKTSATLTIPNGVALVGDSQSFGIPFANYGFGGLPLQGAVIAPASPFANSFGGAGVLQMTAPTSQGGGQRVENISIDGTGAPISNNMHGILMLNGVACVTLRDVTVYGNNNLGGDGLHAVAGGAPSHPPDLINMFSCHWSGMGGAGVSMAGAADSYINSCEATGNTTYGWHITNCNNTRFVGCKGEQTTGGPGWLFTAAAGFTGIVHVLACTSQGNSQDGFQVTGTGTGTYQLIGCASDGDGTGGTYSGLNVTSFSGIALADGWNTRVGAGAPAYGISMTSSNVLQAANANVAGGTSALNDGGSNSQFLVNSNFLCAPVSYAPGSPATLSVSSLTFAAFDSTHVSTGSFAAPPSGSVVVECSCVVVQATGTAAIAFALAAHGTVTPLVGNSVQGSAANTSVNAPMVLKFLVTGLTPGTSYNFDLLGATGSASDALEIVAAQFTATTITAGNRGGPVIMTVQAV